VKASIISVTHNSADVIGELAGSVPVDAELVIVDNASQDQPGRAARAAGRPVTVVELPTNGGFGRGCNVGAGVAQGDVLIFTNPDCRLGPGAVAAFVTAVSDQPHNIYGPAFCNEAGGEWHNLRRRSTLAQELAEHLPAAKRWLPARLRRDLAPGHPAYRQRGDVDYLQGACLAIDRSLFLGVGGFDEDYFLYSEEETLCDAVRVAGGRCIYLADVRVTHVGATSTDAVSEFALRHLYRSKAIFYRKRHGEAVGLLCCIGLAGAILTRCGVVGLTRRLGHRTDRPSVDHYNLLVGLLSGATYKLGRL
jgi:N-acetylglucosaminyl-diphospho-decaprenol L-rhamnosyltransferase